VASSVPPLSPTKSENGFRDSAIIAPGFCFFAAKFGSALVAEQLSGSVKLPLQLG